MHYGGFWIRAVATIIDFIIVGIFLLIADALLGSTYSLFEYVEGIITYDIETGAPLEGVDIQATELGQIAWVVTWWLYESVMFSSNFSATIGKIFLGMKVLDADENRLNFWHATGRHFAKYVSFISLGIGFLFIPFTRRKRAAHDLIAKTYVVMKAAVENET